MADDNIDTQTETASRKEQKQHEKLARKAEKEAAKEKKSSEKAARKTEGDSPEPGPAEKGSKKAGKKRGKENVAPAKTDGGASGPAKDAPGAPRDRRVVITPLKGAPLRKGDLGGDKILTDKAFDTICDTLNAGKITNDPEVVRAFVRTVFAKDADYDMNILTRFMEVYGAEESRKIIESCLERSFRKSRSPEPFGDVISACNAKNIDMQGSVNIFEKGVVSECDRDYINSIKNMPGGRKLFEAIDKGGYHGSGSHLATIKCAPGNTPGNSKDWLFSLGAAVLARDIDSEVAKLNALDSLKKYNDIVVPDLQKWNVKYSALPAYASVAGKYRGMYRQAAARMQSNPPRFEDFQSQSEAFLVGKEFISLVEKEAADKAACTVLSKELAFCGSVGDFNSRYRTITGDSRFTSLATAATVKEFTEAAAARRLLEQKNMDDVMAWNNGFDAAVRNSDAVRNAGERSYAAILRSAPDVGSLMAAYNAAGAFVSSGTDVMCTALAALVAGCGGLAAAVACAEAARESGAFGSEPVVEALRNQYRKAVEAADTDDDLLRAYKEAGYDTVRDAHKDLFADCYAGMIRLCTDLASARACYEKCRDTSSYGSGPAITALTGIYRSTVMNADSTEKLLQALRDVDHRGIRDSESCVFARSFAALMPGNVEDLDKLLETVREIAGNEVYARTSACCIDAAGSEERSDLEYFESLAGRVNGLPVDAPEMVGICSRLSGKLADCLEPSFHEDGTVDSLDDAVSYVRYCGGWEDHDAEKVHQALGVIHYLDKTGASGEPVYGEAFDAYKGGRYAREFETSSGSHLSYETDLVNDIDGRESYLKSLAGFEASDDVGRCYFSLAMSYVNSIFIPDMMTAGLKTMEDLCRASDRTSVDTSRIELGYAVISSLTPWVPTLTSSPSEAASYLKGFAEWRIDTTRPIVHVPAELYSEYDAGTMVHAVLRLADAVMYAFEGRPGQAFDAVEASHPYIAEIVCSGHDDMKLETLAAETLLTEYEMDIYASEYSSAQVAAKKFEKVDQNAAVIMDAYANYQLNSRNKVMLRQIQGPFDRFLKKLADEHMSENEYWQPKAGSGKLAAAYYVAGLMNFSRSDWEPAKECAANAETAITARTEREKILMSRIHLLQADIALRNGNRIEFESRTNKAIRTLRDLPQSAIVTNLLADCDKRLDSGSAPGPSPVVQQHQAAEVKFFPPGVGRYQVTIPHIGAGGAYKVYKAVDTQTNDIVALRVPVTIEDITAKVPPTANRQLVTPFNEEMQIWGDVSQEVPGNVVTLLDSSTRPFPWSVCEFADTDVDKSFDSMGKPVKLEMIDSLLAALEAMDELGIIHNDIKPNNIFLVKGRWQLGDFDSAFEVGYPKNFKITDDYASPELIACRDDLDGMGAELTVKSDIWSVGVLLYYVLNNRNLPFGTGPDSAERQRTGNFIPSSFNRNFDAVYERIFKVDPAERPSASELREIIRNA